MFFLLIRGLRLTRIDLRMYYQITFSYGNNVFHCFAGLPLQDIINL